MEKSLIKESILALKPYVPHDYNYIYKLDANESPFNIPNRVIESIQKKLSNLALNRYPDTDSTELRRELEKYINVDYKNILVGNGSDEMINIIINTFVDKGDVVISYSPTFVMYKHITKIIGGRYISIPTNSNFQVDIDRIIRKANKEKAKIIFLCSPNNPTGKKLNKEEILKVIRNTESLVVVDEAYIEFSQGSIVGEVKNFKRLIVLRTLSKAFGLAGIRTGYIVANDAIIDSLNSVKPPYNLNSISQLIAIELLKNKDDIFKNIEKIKKERERMYNQLKNIEGIKPYTSEANFIFVKVPNNKKIFKGLLKKGIMVRAFGDGILENHLRITVGKKKENDFLISSLKEVINNEEIRKN
ncbi:histidinol-phosphate transaminase [Thermohalobacter berrensis]|uniref:Histidinol-phosphate aminotransferase n=1 Tax=Thermohalobacter berrensis TaxID=99594 RepID=A0A419T5V6_9FIRM|nr:histidinol-phosphate transaminase [Thermohalobacter berrensis]RKD32924.1 histidinol-phosphate transaminase [Thermohalobacter berrensis]